MGLAKKIGLAAKPIPEGFHTITASLIVKDARTAIEFYKKAFNAEEIHRFHGADGRSIMHAELKIGDSRCFIADEMREMGNRSPDTLGGSPFSIYLYVHDVDTVVNRAVGAGAVLKEPIQDMFWGDRCGIIRDPFGYEWAVATHKEDVPKEELGRLHDEWVQGIRGDSATKESARIDDRIDERRK